MEDAKLGDQISGVLGGIHGQSLGDNEEGLGELSDGELLSGGQSSCEVIKIDRKCHFDGTATSNEGVRLQNALNNAERVMDRSLNLIEEELVGASDNNCLGGLLAHTLEEHVFPVTDFTFFDLGTGTEIIWAESFNTIFVVYIGERDDNSAASRFGDTTQIEFLDSSNGDNTGLYEILEGEVIDTAGAENNVGAGLNDLLAAVSADIHFLLADLIKLLSILAENLNTHLKAELVEVEVDEGELTVLHHLWHTLGAAGSLDSISIDKLRLFGGSTVSLEDVDVLDGVLGRAGSVGHLDVLHGSDDHVAEEVRLGSQKLGAHGGLGGSQYRFFVELGLAHNQLLLDEVDRLLEGHSVTSHDGGWVNLGLDQLVGSLEKLSGENND